ncbi:MULTISPECIES: MAB_1171c family putative transporter [Streptomycetaceae]|uniref:DUF6545 domain-containing protein n=1 Tax=Streptantibioticus cattleyicolor (strain ATCC 35852 / DSM 46488 / JCM 4925 / NBRC 14057 / NRRL 8057) TaxID=1003195 RepID=F8K0G0_STREN|nr:MULTISPECIES: MAB_1171c family putative transporter [Streptomycetaceae]AEW97364.1 hypothetical protein SCATT_49930 [Streptantibioticus cattleyicolor NRRL 8057 = DSM 46488]MYS61814.1 hypothetical protein [Streptomyces sp. SID5468]CCB77687.1 conserved membrane protein of unknown function [Streptantibioticus cattleyicolor NRRL 8057 = DSM 46488]
MSTAKIVVLVMLWAVTFWRLPSAVRVARQRALWVAFACISAASTLGVPEIQRVTDLDTGVHNLATLGKNLLGIAGSAAILDFVISIARPAAVRRSRPPLLAFAAVAMAGMTVLFAATPRATEADNFFDASIGSLPGTGYCLVFLGYLGVAMSVATWLFWSYGRHAGAGSLRVGLRVLGTGTALGALYSLFRSAHLAVHLTRLAFPLDDVTANAVADVVEYSAITLIIVGNSIPAVGVLLRSLRDRRSLRRLRPLWSSLTEAVPDVVLDAPVSRGPRIRLHRRVIEIRDAALVLAAYGGQEVRDRARRAAERADLPAAQRAALAEALWLRTARAAKLTGAAPVTAPAAAAQPPSPELDFDFPTEVRRLRELAAVYHSPVADALAASLTLEDA